MTKPILTVIPTTGAPELRQAVESALPHSDVLLVTDSPDGLDRVQTLLRTWGPPDRIGPCTLLVLPFRVGGGEWAGHRIYAAVPHLVNHEFISFLDEDNWYGPDHLPAMFEALRTGADVAWSYRTIHAKDGTEVCRDECESLGPDAIGVGGRRLVDTSCWAFRTPWARKQCHRWDGAWGADSAFTEYVRLLQPAVKSTGLYSLHYRLGASERSPKAEFFLEGNRRMRERGSPSVPRPGP